MPFLKSRFFHMAAALSFTSFLAGCGGEKYETYRAPSPIDVPYSPEIREEADQMLAESAARVKDAQTKLAMVAAARTPPPASSVDESSLPPELQSKTTVDFTGPGYEIAKSLAQNIGYGFIMTGGDPLIPGIVTVQMQDMSVAKVLEDVGLQVQQYATLIVDPSQKRIEYRNESARRKDYPSSAPKPQARQVKKGIVKRKSVTRFKPADCKSLSTSSSLPAGFVAAGGGN
ncbi:hypothetical protein CSR02_15690 [Acetobacter pomorum]|uniref:Uncharacterized protein n=1 Tax=Acetobacter pomorum TaxID=65959 RepID=A0A2G4R7W1_9PROT|nr:DotD/TraH family lipoprotein [Acetobacter pomorum]PHY92644.1 hypothetical protein CSR02_15690 [Acetobacter pomorum]